MGDDECVAGGDEAFNFAASKEWMCSGHDGWWLSECWWCRNMLRLQGNSRWSSMVKNGQTMGAPTANASAYLSFIPCAACRTWTWTAAGCRVVRCTSILGALQVARLAVKSGRVVLASTTGLSGKTSKTRCDPRGHASSSVRRPAIAPVVEGHPAIWTSLYRQVTKSLLLQAIRWRAP